MGTNVKICGLTNLADALHAAQNGAQYLGFIHFSGSKRFVPEQDLLTIPRDVKAAFPTVQTVGVFVDTPIDTIICLTRSAGLDLVQLHGDQPAPFSQYLLDAGLRVIRAVRVGEGAPPFDWETYPCHHHLCDTFHAAAFGGTGTQLDPQFLPPPQLARQLLLAGGLTPDNVRDAIVRVRPFAVDVSSGVEAKPGIKDPAKVELFIRNAQAA